MSRLSRQCGILNISQPYRPPRPATGTASLHFYVEKKHILLIITTTMWILLSRFVGEMSSGVRTWFRILQFMCCKQEAVSVRLMSGYVENVTTDTAHCLACRGYSLEGLEGCLHGEEHVPKLAEWSRARPVGHLNVLRRIVMPLHLQFSEKVSLQDCCCKRSNRCDSYLSFVSGLQKGLLTFDVQTFPFWIWNTFNLGPNFVFTLSRSFREDLKIMVSFL
jgi:hypothetical protein